MEGTRNAEVAAVFLDVVNGLVQVILFRAVRVQRITVTRDLRKLRT